MRPRISRPPRTENVTAGSVGAIAAPSRPLVIQEKSSSQWAETRDQAGRRERADDAQREDRDDRDGGAPPADVHAAVEQDHDQRDHRDPLDRDERDRVLEARRHVRGDRGREQEQRGTRDREPLGDRPPEERQREPGRDDEDIPPKSAISSTRTTLGKDLRRQRRTFSLHGAHPQHTPAEILNRDAESPFLLLLARPCAHPPRPRWAARALPTARSRRRRPRRGHSGMRTACVGGVIGRVDNGCVVYHRPDARRSQLPALLGDD